MFSGLIITGAIILSQTFLFAQSCIQEELNRSITCRGNDVRITFADNVRSPDGAPLTGCTKGETFSFIADLHVQTTVKSAYNVGLYFATHGGDANGDGSKRGICSATIIRDRHRDPEYPYLVTLGTAVAANLDGNTCLDITAKNGWRNIGGKAVTVRVNNVACHDSDGDGKLNLSNCTSWGREPGEICNSSKHTAPNSPLNCKCDSGFNVPIFVNPNPMQVTKDFRPELPSESRRGVSFVSDSEISGRSHP